MSKTGKAFCVLKRRVVLLSLMSVVLGSALLLSGCGEKADDKRGATAQAGTAAGEGLVISEVMSSNTGSLKAPDGSTPDWIELHNTGNRTISLKGYMLSDNAMKPDKFVFPAGTLSPGGYLLVYAAGKEAVSAGSFYLPFKLSGTGEGILLISPDGKVVDRFDVPPLPADISYGRSEGGGAARLFFGDPTPGKANRTEGKPTAEAAMAPQVSGLLINEYCTRNATLYDETGGYPDWVELYNSGSDKIELAGYKLSDDLTNLDKWKFPAVTIAPKSYLLLLLSGKKDRGTEETEPAEGRLHVDFRLSAEDTQLVITDPRGRTVATAPVEDLPLNVSKGRLPGDLEEWGYFPRPTPGAANSTASFPTLSQVDMVSSRDLLISEVFAMDGASAAKPEGDWVELYNNTGKTIDLTGYGLSDDLDQPYRMKLEQVAIASKSTVVVKPQDFAISALGETLVLTSPDGVVEDAFTTGHLRTGMSSGREMGSGSLAAVYYVKPTKGVLNSGSALKAYTGVPTITVSKENGDPVDGLYISGPVVVTVESAEPGARIYYTINGKTPTRTSTSYSAPLRVTKSTVVKAIAIRPDHLPSDPAIRTLLREDPHSLPVVSLSGDPDALLGEGGILTSGESTGEIAVDFAFYDADGTLGIESPSGVELHGQFSRREAQRSLEVKFRSSYGRSELTYPFFEDYDVSTFRRLVLRTSGQDWKSTKVRDAFMTRVIYGQLNVDVMAIRNCVVYINGQYWGLYEVREKLDQFYVASHHGADPDQVEVVKGNNIVVAGSAKDWQDLYKYCKTHDLRERSAYESVLARIDEESLMDFLIAESFFSNTDSGNKKVWRPLTDGGQYRWMVHDLDWGLFPSTYQWDSLKGDVLDPNGHGISNLFQTAVQVKLVENPDFEKKFIRRYAEFLNTTFKTKRMLKFLDESVDLVRDEMPRQIARWKAPSSVAVWEKNVDELRRVTSEKRALMIGILQQNFGLSTAKMKELFPDDF